MASGYDEHLVESDGVQCGRSIDKEYKARKAAFTEFGKHVDWTTTMGGNGGHARRQGWQARERGKGSKARRVSTVSI